MYYSVRHVTRFRYSEPVTESAMQVRMEPRSDGAQRCLGFELRTSPKSAISTFTDHLGNRVHAFDVPDRHSHLTIRAQSQVEILPASPLPDTLDEGSWGDLDAMTATDEHWDLLVPSEYAHPTDRLRVLAKELRVSRGHDPLTTLRDITAAIHDSFEYDTGSTDVDSPIDEALASRHGVCQDFSHIMIALVRQLAIPCRYVSGYLFHTTKDHDRSPIDASHAWIEALIPTLGWVGFDPTNNLLVTDRHIRVAVGRDYADVPPTRGVFKGRSETELAVSVRVSPSEAPQSEEADDDVEPIFRRTNELDQLSDGELREQPQ